MLWVLVDPHEHDTEPASLDQRWSGDAGSSFTGHRDQMSRGVSTRRLCVVWCEITPGRTDLTKRAVAGRH